MGLMRHGRLLAEDCPTRLLDIYNHSSLEDVFLELCIKEDQGECPEDEKLNNEVGTVGAKPPDMYRYTLRLKMFILVLTCLY